MKNADKPAMPPGSANINTGLTKREYAAIEIAKGLASATDQDGTWTTDAECISTMAIKCADTLLEKLEKQK